MAGCFVQKFFKLALIILFFQHFTLQLIGSLWGNLKYTREALWKAFCTPNKSSRYEYSLEIQWIDHNVKVINIYHQSRQNLLSYLCKNSLLVKYGSRISKALIITRPLPRT